MSVIGQGNGSSGAFTITLAALLSGGMRQSSVLDIGALIAGGPVLDILVMLQTQITAGAPGSQLAVNWYLALSLDGTTWPEKGATAPTTLGGGDGAYTGSVLNLSPMRAVQFTAQNIQYSVIQSMNTVSGLAKLAKKAVIVVDNETGQDLDHTAANSQLIWQVVYASNV